MRGRLAAAGLAVTLSAGCAGSLGAGEGGLPPQPPRFEEIYHLPTDLKLSFGQMMDMVSAAQVVYVGELHSNLHAHRVQLEVIAELQRRFPGRVAIGMEMFRLPQQESLDRWTRGELTELEFLKESRWYENWASDFGYYRDILAFARDEGLDVIALNPPQELQRELAMAGPGPLPAELAERLPEIAPPEDYQRETLGAIFKGHEGGGDMLEAFIRVQLLWEEHMAERIVDYLGTPRGDGKKMVVLAGALHVRHGLGVPRKVLRRSALPYSTVLSEEIEVPEEEREKLSMDVEIPFIPLPAGDFLWYVPYEDLDDKGVRLGIMMREEKGRVVVEKVLEGSPAEEAGLREGDIILSLDGLAVEGAGDVLLVVKSRKEGDRLAVRLLREGRELGLTALLARPPEGGAH